MNEYYDIEAEKTILARILMEGFDSLPDSQPGSGLPFSDTHALIFNSARALRDRGEAVNSITVADELRASGNLDRAGGLAYLSELITVSHFDGLLVSACDAVAAKFKQRELRRTVADALGQIDDGNHEEALASLNRALPCFTAAKDAAREPKIRFFSPSELRDFEPDDEAVLVGENHILRGEIFVIGGEPGVGKSTAATELAICGATGRDWLGLKIHCRFKTLIIQNENGRFRLMGEYRARSITPEIEASIRVSEPPAYGMTLEHPDFLRDVRLALESLQPDVVLFDPWNSAARDDKAKDYGSAFDALKQMLQTGSKRPALGIIAHTRKPSMGEQRIGGSGLMHTLAGSYILSSVPRAVFIMTRGKALQEADDSVAWFNPKNNNGPCVCRSAWRRGPDGFTSLPDFDWTIFDGDGEKRRVIEFTDIEEALGDENVKKSEAVKRLVKITGLGERACQKAIAEDGKFADQLKHENGCVSIA
ncbi:MAG: AAA family ATPase [Verrucomicrobia bacterium]|nr:AAA family ATPase [Verrucomicrobiota bacterium]